MNDIKHLYIHIPFCKSICTYCNFKKELYEYQKANLYISKLIEQINNINNVFDTIYIGGGTPNCIDNILLDKLLNSLNKNINSNTEFTIELNPEFVNEKQIEILKKNNINRVSIGVQILNEKVLKKINRIHKLKDIYNCLNLLIKNNLNNISCDFIYNLPNMSNSDIDLIIEFINKYNLKHISYYALEIKDNSILKKIGHKIDLDKEEQLFDYLMDCMKNKTKLKQYEISNWSISKKYQSKHNKAYWNMNGWIGLGYGSCGYENMTNYENIGSIKRWYKKECKESLEEYYKSILIMGLRQIDGIDLNVKRNNNAFNYFKQKLNSNLYVIKNNKLICKNINLLNSLLIDLY